MALTEWEQLKAKLDAAEHPTISRQGEKLLKGHSYTAQWIAKMRAVGNDQDINEVAADTGRKIVSNAITAFLSRQRAKVDTGNMSAGRYDTLQRCLEHFAQTVGKTHGVDRINGAVLADYHTRILREIENGWSADYAMYSDNYFSGLTTIKIPG